MTTEDIHKNINIEDLQGEIWKEIPDYNGKYSASNMGRIKRNDIKYLTKTGKNRSLKTLILKQKVSKKGYCQITLSDIEGNTKCKGVHRWVMYAFHGISSLQVDHINGVKINNKLENLRYCTQRENINYRKDVTPSNFSSSLYGTYQDKDGKWVSYISIQGTNHYLGVYDKEYEAHLKYMEAWDNWRHHQKLPEKYINPNKTSVHKRVDFHKASGKWRVRTSLDQYIGIFSTEYTALRVTNLIEYLINSDVEITKELIKKVRRKYGKDKRLRSKIINTTTGDIYYSIGEASRATGVNYSTLTHRLKNNKGNIKYVRK